MEALLRDRAGHLEFQAVEVLPQLRGAQDVDGPERVPHAPADHRLDPLGTATVQANHPVDLSRPLAQFGPPEVRLPLHNQLRKQFSKSPLVRVRS